MLKGFGVVSGINVAWGDMDAFQHVNNVVYFRYFETARIDYGAKIGITDKMESEGMGPILAWTDCKYIRPVTFPDVLHVGVRVSKLEGSDMWMEYMVVSEKQNRVVATGNSRTVYYDYRNAVRADYPAELLEKVEEVEGGKVAGVIPEFGK